MCQSCLWAKQTCVRSNASHVPAKSYGSLRAEADHGRSPATRVVQICTILQRGFPVIGSQLFLLQDTNYYIELV